MVGINLAALWKRLAAGFAAAGHGHALTGAEITGALPIAKGGTGAGDAAGARGNIGAAAEKHGHAQEDVAGLTEAMGTQWALKGGTAIPRNADLNEPAYWVVGNYYISSNEDAGTVSNTPVALAGRLCVYTPFGDGNGLIEGKAWTYAIQEYIPHTGSGIFRRKGETISPSGDVRLSAWRRVYQEGDGVMKLAVSTSITVSPEAEWKYQTDPDAYYHYYTINGIDASMQVIATLWDDTNYPIGGSVCPIVCVAVSATNQIIVWCADKPTRSKTLRLNFYKAL